jgi:hypothetical protein
MPLRPFYIHLAFLLFFLVPAAAQRIYSPHSVLASGNWYKLSVNQPGIYKIDITFLNNLGVNTSGLSSGSIRIYGNGGQMLPEANAAPRPDDLRENAILVEDGGDGILNGGDYILFYAPGPDQWSPDSANQRFSHHKNLYSDKSYYFLTIGGNGKRVANSPVVSGPSLSVTSYSERYFHELDTVNFLSSGKEWYGEEMSSLPGRSLTRTFSMNIPGMIAGSSLQLNSSCVGRSAGSGSSFDVKINGTSLGQLNIPAVGTTQFDLFARESIATYSTVTPAGSFSLSYTFNPGSVNAQGWLNWFEVFGRRDLSLAGNSQLLFRDWASVGNNAAEFIISNATPATQVWDITDPFNALVMQGSFLSNQYHFINNCSRLREYVAFNLQNLLAPVAEGRVANQDLHAISPRDYIIVVHPPFLAQAQRLARLHEQLNGYRSLVVTTAQVFNEFGSGTPDPVAIRDFLKMYFDKFGTSSSDRLKYVLLFGDASFDYRDRMVNNTNFVPAWENGFSLDPLASYTSDDFYGFLDDNEDINSGSVTNYLDIGLGRVPARNADDAKNFVDKVEAYGAAASLGPWRNNITLIADDEDQNLHLQDAELIASTAGTTAPVFNLDKIYLDAYPQQSGSGGSRYPQANDAINNQVYSGTLIWNYTGHGGSKRLAEEVILDQDIVNGWSNTNKLPLFITATCDFAPYDIPSLNSLGENILLRPKTGAIALMTTTRIVFAYSNRIMNNNYMQFALQQDASGKYRNLGDAIRDAKNYTYQTSADIANNRKFTLLGDPALSIAYPVLRVRPSRINGVPAAQVDTLRAKQKIVIEGEVTDGQGNVLTGFNGNVYPVVFDKPQTVNTLVNDPTSLPASFSTQNVALFKGKASVNNGRFSFSFKVPKDINYVYGNGRLSLYAENGSQDGNGYYTNFIIGGSDNSVDSDREGPEIRAYLNDERFVNGGITNERPVLLLKLTDSSGINTAGTSIGHDLVAVLDNDNNRYFILNDFYESDLNSYQRGTVRFQLPQLDPGTHSLRIKAWDVLNNSREVILDFTVARDEGLQLSHVLNYPNPFTTRTQFWFEHNKPGQDLQVRIQIFTLSGRTIKIIQKTINTPGNRSSDLEWDGRDEYGDRIGKGVYLYRLSVTAPGKLKTEKIGKLAVF